MKKKKLKSSIPLWIASFLFVSSWVVFGVAMALKTVNVGLNGDISFTAIGVHAQVRANIAGTSASDGDLTPIDIDYSTTESELGWDNVKFGFKDENTSIVVKIEVENKSTERALYLVVSENITTNNTIVSRKSDGKEADDFSSTITVGSGQTHTIEITLKVKDKNQSVSDKFALNISLNGEEPKPSTDYPTLAFTYDEANRTASVAKNADNLPTGDLVIPAQVIYNDKVYDVTTIASYGFASCKGLTGVTIPSTIQIIRDHAFHESSAITSIIMADGVTSIEKQAFLGTAITNIVIPKSVTSISSGVFGYCSRLTSIIIPSSVIRIEWEAFIKCDSLTSVTFEGLSGHTWKAGDTDVTSAIADPATAATYLTTDYASISWTRS